VDILVAMGRNAAESALGAARQIRLPAGEPVEIVMTGSLFVKADSRILVESFQARVREGLGERALFKVLKAPPVAGAVLWALEDLRGELPPALKARVIDETSGL
jgi:hypothetical protein